MAATLPATRPSDGPLPAGPRPPLSPTAAAEWLTRTGARSAALVEGWSDQAAIEALARRRGRDLVAERVGVVPIGGITNIGKFVDALGPNGLGLHLAGLCDAAELPHLLRAFGRSAGLGGRDGPAGPPSGFFVCHADLEDELIRALGTAAVEAVLAREGELPSFRRFQAQPAQRGRAAHEQLRRFMGTRARRKIRYGSLLVDALRPEAVPPPLDGLLVHLAR